MSRLDFSIHNESATYLSEGRTVAESAAARLRLMLTEGLRSLRWIKLRYRSSFFDDPVRPLIGFTDGCGKELVQPMNGPILGRGEWIGRIPDGTTSLAIYPVNGAGVFHFDIEEIAPLSRLELLRRGMSLDPIAVISGLGAKIIGATEERWETLKFAATPTPVENYPEWFNRLHRKLETRGIDRPRSDWSLGPAFHFILPLNGGSAEGLRRTIRSLRDQAYQRWTLKAVLPETPAAELQAVWEAESEGDQRLAACMPSSAMSELKTQNYTDYVALVSIGDTLPEYATAVLAEAVVRNPMPSILYGDEDAISPGGVIHSPLFKPDWSPVFFTNLNYLGRLTCIRIERLLAAEVRLVEDFVGNEDAVLARLASAMSDNEVRHIRRILYRRARQREDAVPQKRTTAEYERAIDMHQSPSVSIVIPTRDRADLLGECIASLKRLTDYPNYDVVVVDNGSTEPAALELLQSFERSKDFKVVRCPGRFNFSALSNAGARASQSEVLVFLNNDTVIFDGNWLRALVDWAARPEVGVVGAKLLFADRSLEHAGVVLGHSGIAGHLYHGHSENEPGYLDHLTVPHEVMAVTGACIAVQRNTFESVNGFDEENLPIDLNDIDFCLKVHEQGLSNIWTPHSVLYHLQSASRGHKLKPFQHYRREREFFRNRWAHVIRDDPYFHPGLSLYSHRLALA